MQEQVKQEEESHVHPEIEPLEIIMQRRAIYLSQKKDKNPEEQEEVVNYRTYRLANYISKKPRRNFDKKIVYTTRKTVADRRIRFKGKFINEYQAREMLGLTGQEQTFDELKEMMKRMKTKID
jgi:hypothetical protein